ncbi:alpha/beta hydrolase [Nocardioides sp. NPDC051685]|uniref:alpha/beta hydrolase n=1 Tax=Nocardioides sp. NPDC051685 TaxID=3364334 RepID=UPI0037A3E52D
MPIDPALEPILAQLQPLPDELDDIDGIRAMNETVAAGMVGALVEPGPEVRDSRAYTVKVAGGTIEVLVYQPFEPGPHPAHLFLHGGGWAFGSPRWAVVDVASRERCAGAGCVVIAADYRKAPEHPFPAAIEDCYTVLHWIVEHADELGIRADLITVGGQSAGANLAAALALKVRDEGGPRIALQLLEVPALDLTLSLPSHAELDGYALTRHDAEILLRLYFANLDAARDSYASPLHALDLAGLPPAHIMTAEYDMLRDDGAQYAARLAEAGVPVTHSMYPGQVHISPALTQLMESSREWRRELLAVLKNAHAGGALRTHLARGTATSG